MFSNKQKKFEAILNNLLDLSPNDKAVFTRVDNNYFFDFYKMFGQKAFEKIYTKKEFKIELIEERLKHAKDKILQTQDYESAMQVIADFDLEISDIKKRLLKKDFAQGIEKISEELEMQFQKQSVKWKMFFNRAKEINEQTNIWPIHLGFLYVKVNVGDKSIYAPLFLKEAYLTFENARPKLFSKGEIKPNDKLFFLLKHYDFDVDTSSKFSRQTIKELYEDVKSIWVNTYPNITEIGANFEQLNPEQITNEALTFAPGIVLGLFQPAGGYIRNRMIEIIEKDAIKTIIPVSFNKNSYVKKIDEMILDPKKSLFKISPTNFSQDQAIASSLLQNTVIWGPPGTGKSQTIVNLLTNILIYGRTAVVCSQKKAALEVIANRMGALKQFCLFMFNSSEGSKKSFYKPLQEYIDYIEHFDDDVRLKALRVLTNKELRYIKEIGNYAKDSRFIEITKIIPEINQYLEELEEDKWETILTLPDFYKYPEIIKFSDKKELQKWMLKNNGFNILKFFDKKRKIVINIADKLFDKFNGSNLNIKHLVAITRNSEMSDFKFIRSLLSILPSEDKPQVSDEEEIKKHVARLIVERYETLSDEDKQTYGEFALTIRNGQTEPYKFISNFARIIKKIFPIIIVTPEADLSAWEREEFNYAIMDESSQIFIEKGLPVLYLAKIKILAGDDQQMKPSNWFGIRVTDEETVYGITESLLDFAKNTGVHTILLNKNYRSNHASLMTFSSKHFYNSSLDVIDSAHVTSQSKAIEVIEANGEWIDSQNTVEAEIALNIIEKNLKNYKKMILLCFNAKQQEAITKTIFESRPTLENALRNNVLLLRNIENIQGDEADLVVATLGYDANAKIYSTYVGRPGGRNALNVAISRAKEKMVVIKSLHSSDVSITGMNGINEDMETFKKWLEFLELSDQEKKDFLSIDLEQTRGINLNNEASESELFGEIKEYILELIKGKPWIQLHTHYNLGTMNVDLMLKKGEESIFALIVDDYEYANKPSEYLKFHDNIKFIAAKEYKTFKFDRTLWEQNKHQIDEIISLITLPDNYLDNNEYADLSENSQEMFIDNNELSNPVTENEQSDNSEILDKETQSETVDTQNINNENIATVTNEVTNDTLIQLSSLSESTISDQNLNIHTDINDENHQYDKEIVAESSEIFKMNKELDDISKFIRDNNYDNTEFDDTYDIDEILRRNSTKEVVTEQSTQVITQNDQLLTENHDYDLANSETEKSDQQFSEDINTAINNILNDNESVDIDNTSEQEIDQQIDDYDHNNESEEYTNEFDEPSDTKLLELNNEVIQENDFDEANVDEDESAKFDEPSETELLELNNDIDDSQSVEYTDEFDEPSDTELFELNNDVDQESDSNFDQTNVDEDELAEFDEPSETELLELNSDIDANSSEVDIDDSQSVEYTDEFDEPSETELLELNNDIEQISNAHTEQDSDSDNLSKFTQQSDTQSTELENNEYNSNQNIANKYDPQIQALHDSIDDASEQTMENDLSRDIEQNSIDKILYDLDLESK
ncbi:AAA domain-containing protein [Mycoplasma sp. HS2188]|uniref:AAA domain-containing protein n=1 Tax=Mycoplasma sp. HS2188 TaxID=2976765 RepID=UPI0021AA858B|nr:AAA domain-containing protein [Mycoplasma sp. HS2188]MCT4469399.1 AAA domain-containing protein [Mycoplasma sp. HS2188]